MGHTKAGSWFGASCSLRRFDRPVVVSLRAGTTSAFLWPEPDAGAEGAEGTANAVAGGAAAASCVQRHKQRASCQHTGFPTHCTQSFSFSDFLGRPMMHSASGHFASGRQQIKSAYDYSDYKSCIHLSSSQTKQILSTAAPVSACLCVSTSLSLLSLSV